MSVSIPLRADLGVESEGIVVDASRRLVLDCLNEDSSAEEAQTASDLLGCSFDRLRREQVQHAKIVVCAKAAPCVTKGATFGQGKRVKGGRLVGHAGGQVTVAQLPSVNRPS
jgi:hypothetical protein